MNLRIKRLAHDDLNLLKQLLRWFQEDDGIAVPTLPGDDYLQRLLSGSAFHAIVALDGDTFIGGLTAFELPLYFTAGTEMFLYEIAVAASYRRLGVANSLIEALKNICAKKGIDIMYVGTEQDNAPAKRPYTVSGGTLEDVAWYTYDLAPPP